MRLTIDHRTVYRFSEPQQRLVQMLRMTPENSHDQTAVAWRIDVDCDAKMRDAHDGYGNATTMLYVEGPVSQIEITVTGEVLTSHSNGVVRGTNEIFRAALYLRATPMTPMDSALADFARDAAGDSSRLTALHRINRAFEDRFAIDHGRPDPGLSVAAAFERETATSRDLAQMFVVAARSIGAPARYVSGYCLIDGNHNPTPHGWAEAWVEPMGWIAFDPSTGRCPEEDYVRVAVALDAIGAAAVAGSRLGEGVEALDVDISVAEAR